MTPNQFWESVDRRGENECWPWTRSMGTRGYGQVYFMGRGRGAHRVAYYLTHRVWPEAVSHSCDNPACCNPAHLWAGSTDNAADMRTKGRGPGLSTVVKKEIVEKCRAQSKSAVAREYGVNVRTVFRIMAEAKADPIKEAYEDGFKVGYWQGWCHARGEDPTSPKEPPHVPDPMDLVLGLKR
jgi:hypothetical protein